MKRTIAIVHDSFLHHGGAETVLLSFVNRYPDAHIYIPLISARYLKELSKKHRVHTSLLSFLPALHLISSLLKPVLIIYWETLNLSRYDIVISSSHSFSSKSVNVHKPTKHVSYIHTPPKYLYSEYNQMSWIKNFPFSLLLSPLFWVLRWYDYHSAQKPDLLIANSLETQKRIKRYYNRTSIVIYPKPIHPPRWYKKKEGKYYLFFSRLEKQKGLELVFETCKRYHLPLVVVGTGSLEKKLKKLAPPYIQFLGYVSEKKKVEVFSHAKALLFAAIDEDYGIAVSEAAAYQVPIVGFDSGAIQEAANSGMYTLFSKFNVNSLIRAILSFEKKSKFAL